MFEISTVWKNNNQLLLFIFCCLFSCFATYFYQICKTSAFQIFTFCSGISMFLSICLGKKMPRQLNSQGSSKNIFPWLKKLIFIKYAIHQHSKYSPFAVAYLCFLVSALGKNAKATEFSRIFKKYFSMIKKIYFLKKCFA